MNRDYANRQIILHWLVVLAIIITYVLAELKGFTPHNSRLHRLMVVTHYSAGFSVLVLMLFRIYLRILHRAREILPSAPRWPLWVAKAGHGLLYLLFIAVPLLGMCHCTSVRFLGRYLVSTCPMPATQIRRYATACATGTLSWRIAAMP